MAAPLVFRVWTPETKMVRGEWNIPAPPSDAEQLVQEIVLAPLMGRDDKVYRLGYLKPVSSESPVSMDLLEIMR